MKHWAIINKETGEHHFAISEAKAKEPPGYSAKMCKFVALDRAPTQHDTFDGKQLVHCGETEKRIAFEAKLNAMSRIEFYEFITKGLKNGIV
jgi:hypothetical protein